MGKTLFPDIMVKLPINAIGFNCENSHKIYEENIWGKFKDLMHILRHLWPTLHKRVVLLFTCSKFLLFYVV